MSVARLRVCREGMQARAALGTRGPPPSRTNTGTKGGRVLRATTSSQLSLRKNRCCLISFAPVGPDARRCDGSRLISLPRMDLASLVRYLWVRGQQPHARAQGQISGGQSAGRRTRRHIRAAVG